MILRLLKGSSNQLKIFNEFKLLFGIVTQIKVETEVFL